jgi:hypothetical protein
MSIDIANLITKQLQLRIRDGLHIRRRTSCSVIYNSKSKPIIIDQTQLKTQLQELFPSYDVTILSPTPHSLGARLSLQFNNHRVLPSRTG